METTDAISPARGTAAGLKRDALGTPGIVFLVLSAAAPLTVMAGIAPLAIAVAGPAAPLGYLVAGVVLVLFSAGFMAMTRHMRAAGGFYGYVTKSLGPSAGLATAALSVVSYNLIQIGLYGLFALQLHALVLRFTGVDVPWPLLAVAAILAVCLVGYRGVDVGAKVLGVLLVAETLILAVVAVAVLARGGANGIDAASFSPAHLADPGLVAVLGLAFGAFVGFESTVLYRSEARDPERTIPRATYIAVGFLALFYAFVSWTVVLAFGSAQVQSLAAENLTDLFFIAADTYVGSWSGAVMAVLLATSLYAMQLAFHNAINRYTYMLSRDGLTPAFLGRTHPRFRSPHLAGLAQTALALAVVLAMAAAGADPYVHLMIWLNTPGVLGIVCLQGLVSLATVVYLRRHREAATNRWIIPVAAVATMLLFAAVYLVLANIGLMTGAEGATNVLIAAVVPAVFAAGLLLARILKKTRPATYEGIATHDGN